VRVCVGTACHVKGSAAVVDAFLRHLNIPAGDDTDPNRIFTIEKVACLGCCTLAPAVQIGEITYGHLTPDTVAAVLEDFLAREKAKHADHARHKKVASKTPPQAEIRIGLGSCCVARGSGKLNDALKSALEETGISVAVKHVGCVGMCYQTPLLEVVLPDGASHLYARVQPEDAKPILLKHFRPSGLRRVSVALSSGLDSLLEGRQPKPVSRFAINVREGHVADFLGRQNRIATESCGVISPVDIEEYISFGGFQSLHKCLNGTSPEKVLEQISASGLRGRGGAGFTTARKWSAVRAQTSTDKYVVCNGDEGDPGAFMDRMLMESYPFRVLEGMIIAALTVGAERGYLYIRAEYPLAVQRIAAAIEQCRLKGFLGQNICNSGRILDLQIVQGAGAFVCGEETALLSSIMGRRGMPRLRPPFPAESGLWDKPTLINNVETYAMVPWILRHGGQSFARLGTATSKGTKVFALAGKVARGGLIEVPMGVTLRQIVEEIGGGIAGGLAFKAVQVGGPSGGCVPERLSDVPVDYESLTSVGAIMGSGGLVVLDETDCMVDIARYFLQFTQNQSCGKCTFCRVGTRRMLEILDRLCIGKGKLGDIEKLEELSKQIKMGSLCGLGKTAPNPVLSTIQYFRDEYEAHLNGKCPAGKCLGLIRFVITDECIGCTLCSQHCPTKAIPMTPYQKHKIDDSLCVRCGTCKKVCPSKAVIIE
ncbi:MAG: 4Fe-4S binding protein, partial [Phycisphaerae bacterium]|nr:4Fe-4S binding protein [Phycisphaerae bacterium]